MCVCCVRAWDGMDVYTLVEEEKMGEVWSQEGSRIAVSFCLSSLEPIASTYPKPLPSLSLTVIQASSLPTSDRSTNSLL